MVWKNISWNWKISREINHSNRFQRVNWFHGIFGGVAQCEKMKNYCHPKKKRFLWTFLFSDGHSVRVEITEIYPHFKDFSWNQFILQLFSEKITLTEFLLKSRGGKFLKLPHCGSSRRIFREINFLHSVEIREFYWYSDFTWNHTGCPRPFFV